MKLESVLSHWSSLFFFSTHTQRKKTIISPLLSSLSLPHINSDQCPCSREREKNSPLLLFCWTLKVALSTYLERRKVSQNCSIQAIYALRLSITRRVHVTVLLIFYSFIFQATASYSVWEDRWITEKIGRFSLPFPALFVSPLLL